MFILNNTLRSHSREVSSQYNLPICNISSQYDFRVVVCIVTLLVTLFVANLLTWVVSRRDGVVAEQLGLDLGRQERV